MSKVLAKRLRLIADARVKRGGNPDFVIALRAGATALDREHLAASILTELSQYRRLADDAEELFSHFGSDDTEMWRRSYRAVRDGNPDPFNDRCEPQPVKETPSPYDLESHGGLRALTEQNTNQEERK